MLLERCQKLEADLDRLSRLRVATVHADSLETRRRQIEAAVADLAPLMECFRVLNRRDIQCDGAQAHAVRLRAQLQKMADDFNRDPSSITTWEGTRVFTELQQIGRSLKERLLVAWQAWTREKSVSINAGLLDVLGEVPGFRSPIARIRGLLTQLANAALTLPRTDDAINQYLQTVDEIEKEWQRLDGGSLSPAVTRFLQLAVAGRAPLDLVTADVLSWLDDHRIREHFYVTIQRGA